MGIRDTKMEAELENNIIEYLVSSQSYVYIKPDEMKISFNRKYAFDEKGLGAILTSSRAINYAYKDINSSEEEVKTAILNKVIEDNNAINAMLKKEDKIIWENVIEEFNK